MSIGAVTIRGGASIDTNGLQYSIFNSGGLSGDTIIEDTGSLLFIVDDPRNPTDAGSGFIINDGGTLRFDTSPPPVVSSRSLDINAGGLFEGAGTMNQLGRTGPVSVDGTLRVSGGTLTCNPWDSGVVFDWDGQFGGGTIEIEDGSTLVIAMEVDPLFDGLIEMGDDAVLDVQDDWGLVGRGAFGLDVFADPATPARVRGGDLTISGEVELAFGSLILEAPTTIQGGADIQLLGPNFLRFDAPATVNEPSALFFSALWIGSLIVNDDVIIGTGAGTFDMDGVADFATIEVWSNDTLTIDVAQLDQSDDTFDGSLRVFGDLEVHVADGEWEMAGDLYMSSSSGPVIRGDAIRISGSIETDENSTIEADAVFVPGSVVTMGNASNLSMLGQTTTLGGLQVTGGSRFELLGPDAAVIGASTVDADLPVTLGDNTTFDVSAPFTVIPGIRSETPGTAIRGTTIIRPGGYLDVDSPHGSTQLFTGTLQLNGGGGNVLLRGERFRLEGNTTVSGHAILESAIDLTGSLTFGSNSGLTLRGGTVDEPNNVEAGATISPGLPSAFLNIEAPTRVGISTSLGSTTDVRVEPIGSLTLLSGAHAGKVLINEGEVRFGDADDPISVATTNYYEQRPGGKLVVRISPDGADALHINTVFPTVDAIANLGGELAVIPVDGFTPGVDDTYTIITADLCNGAFSTVTGPSSMSVLYGTGSVLLVFTDPACAPADLAAPFGTLDFFDVLEYLARFDAGC